MQKVKETKITTTVRTHTFYCDTCGKELGTRSECEDGYYDELGVYENSIRINGGWFHLKLNLCDECRDKKAGEIEDALIKLGYKEEDK